LLLKVTGRSEFEQNWRYPAEPPRGAGVARAKENGPPMRAASFN
jgi:hypothetical protein